MVEHGSLLDKRGKLNFINKQPTRKSVFLTTLLILLVFSASCQATNQPEIDLAALTPLPTTDFQGVNPIRVAIAAVISPQGTLESYTPLLDYLSKQLGRPVVRVQGSSYSETNEILKAGLVDLAFVCTGAFIHGSDEFGMQILVVPEINQESVYYSWVITPVDSPIETIEDLRSRVFAFTDPLSLTGWMYPNFMLTQMGENSEAFFSQTFFTYSHDRSIHSVADGFADGAAVDSLIFNYLLKREPSLAEKIRIIHKSPAFGMPPVVVNPNIDPVLRDKLLGILLSMADNPEGQAALATLGVDRFVTVDEDLYASARQVDQSIPYQTTLTP